MVIPEFAKSLRKFREHGFRQTGIANAFTQFLQGGKTEVGHLLLADLEEVGHVAIRPALDEEQLQHLDAQVIAVFFPFLQEPAQAFGQGLAFQFPAFLAARQAGGGLVRIRFLVQ
jgi:hypothetical protein